jgi:proteic killer suppression protein
VNDEPRERRADLIGFAEAEVFAGSAGERDTIGEGAGQPACAYTIQVYNIPSDQASPSVQEGREGLGNGPVHVAQKLQNWVEDVEERGVEAVRKIYGYHDEPLKGALKGQRSIRLNKGYRAYYRVVKDAVEFLRVEGVDKHVY